MPKVYELFNHFSDIDDDDDDNDGLLDNEDDDDDGDGIPDDEVPFLFNFLILLFSIIILDQTYLIRKILMTTV